MTEVITIGVDLAKNVYQVHGVDAVGWCGFPPPVEAGSDAAVLQETAALPGGHGSLRDLAPLGSGIRALGHQVRLMPPRYVKPYVKRNKNDMADAEAICEAVTRPTMRFVEIKTPEQQSVLMLHRTRHLFVRQRTTLINALTCPSGRVRYCRRRWPQWAGTVAEGHRGWR